MGENVTDCRKFGDHATLTKFFDLSLVTFETELLLSLVVQSRLGVT